MRDVDIRGSLRADVEREHAADPDTSIIDELGLRQGQVRVDLAVVNGVLKGYEIKSLADTLRRLPGQVQVYSQVLDLVTIVLEERHRADACAMIPDWWEVAVASKLGEEITIEVVRAGKMNGTLDKRALAELLWHDEALTLLRARDAARGLARKPRAFAWDRLCECYDVDEIRAAVRSQLKARRQQQPAR